MQSGVAKVWELTVQFSDVGGPHKKDCGEPNKLLLERNWAPTPRSAQPPRGATTANPRADWQINTGKQAPEHKPREDNL